MKKEEFLEINELERLDLMFMLATEDVDTAVERWNLFAEIDEDGEEAFAFDPELAKELVGEELAQQMDERVRATFAKNELQEQMNRDIAEGNIIIDEDGNLIDLRAPIEAENVEVSDVDD